MNKAAKTLKHYFQTAFEAAGLHWDYDNDTEIEEAVQSIIEVAQPELDTTETAAELREICAAKDKAMAGLYQKLGEMGKECDELRELLREILSSGVSFSNTELEKKCYLVLSEPE